MLIARGEPCARKLVYEITHAPKDRDFEPGILRVFDAGHQFEALSIRWLRLAGFDLRDRGADGEQFGFAAAGGRLRGHADGVIVGGPAVGLRWPALWEHKALGQKSWTDLVKRGLRLSKPIYFAQVQLYMVYLDLEVALLTALNRDTTRVTFDGRTVEYRSLDELGRALAVLRGAEMTAARRPSVTLASFSREGSR
jgi:hypothetical protein